MGVPESYGNSPGSIWALLGHTGKERKGEEVEGRKEGGRRPLLLVLFGLGGGGGARGLPWTALLFSLMAHEGPLTPGGVPVTPGTPEKSRFLLERFRYPNIGFQYINLYVSTISRLFTMSVIISGTPNNLRYIKTQKLIIPIVTEL